MNPFVIGFMQEDIKRGIDVNRMPPGYYEKLASRICGQKEQVQREFEKKE